MLRPDQFLFLALFGAFCVGVWLLVHWAVPQWGLYFTLPWIGGCLLIAWLFDRLEKPNSEER